MALKACSLAAQGLWMRMLCVAAQHDPTGYVSINRVGLDPDGIARIAGAGVDEVRSLIDELSLNGVFARDRYGVIYNRRMIRDERKSAIARKNGKLGGNPKLTNCNNKENSPSVNPSDMSEDKACLKLKPLPLKKDSTSSLRFDVEKDIRSSFHYDLIGARDARAAAAEKKKPPKKLSQELPDNWQPDQTDRDYATGKGMSPEQFESTLDAMRFWAKSKGASYVDWHAAFKGWLRRNALKPQARAGNGPYDDQKYQARDTVGMARQILDEKKRRKAEQENRILEIGDMPHDD